MGDRIFGFDGDDLLHGFEGKDELQGDGGNDTLYGDRGNDILVGGLGFDYLVGGLGNDALYGRGDDDVLLVGEGDFVNPGDGADDIIIDLGLGPQKGTITGKYDEFDHLDLSNLEDPTVTSDGNDLLVFDAATGTDLRFVDGGDIGSICLPNGALVPVEHLVI